MNMEIKYPLNGKYCVGSRMNSINDAAALNYFHAVSVNKSCQQEAHIMCSHLHFSYSWLLERCIIWHAQTFKMQNNALKYFKFIKEINTFIVFIYIITCTID